MTLANDHYSYRVTWSEEDGEHVAQCDEFPSLSWLAKTPEGALRGIRRVVAEVVTDMETRGETVPRPLAFPAAVEGRRAVAGRPR
jgi:predicted RNase H-like HicB family nuclease